MTTERAASAAEAAGERYRVTLDRERCEGVFACLVRDERFVEATDGLATIDSESASAVGESVSAVGESASVDSQSASAAGAESDRRPGTVSAQFEDERIDAARQAAAACPLDAIDVDIVDVGASDAAAVDAGASEDEVTPDE